MRVRSARVHLAPLRSVARQPRLVEIGVAFDAIAPDAAAHCDVTQQRDQGRQLRLGERVDAVAIVDEFDGNGTSAGAVDVMRQLVFGHAGAERAIAVDHVVDAENGMRFDLAQVVVERAGVHPDGLAGQRIAGRATRRMDDDHVDGLRANGAGAARLGAAGCQGEYRDNQSDRSWPPLQPS